MRSVVRYWLSFLFVFCIAYGTWAAIRYSQTPSFEAEAAGDTAQRPIREEADEPLTHFVLQERSGEEFDSRSLEGRPWIGSFFFTSCPSACWKMNRVLEGLQEEWKDQDITFVSISCDPDTDSLEALRTYADLFHADPEKWLFLRGDMPLVEKIGRDLFPVTVERRTHSDRLILFDQNGEVRGTFRSSDPEDVTRLRKLMDEVLSEQDDTHHATPSEPVATDAASGA